MNKVKIVVTAALSLMALASWAEWQYVATGAAGSKHPSIPYITDGNWELKLVSWVEVFQTSGTWANSYLAGSGKLDLAAAQADLGKRLSPAGHYGNATQITELVLPDDFSTIDGNFCPNCTSLVKISGGKPTTIGEDAFKGCTALETFDMDLSATTSIGARAFNGITKIDFEFDLPALTTLGARPFTVNGGGSPCQVKSFRAPLLTVIPEQAFWNVTALTSAVFSAGLTSIGASAFYGCSSLASFSPSLVPTTLSVSSVCESAFYGCTSLAQPVAIADETEGMVSFCVNAFNGAGFTKLDMSQSKCCFNLLRAFRNCNQLEEVWFSPAQTNLLPWIGGTSFNIFGTGLKRFYFTGVAPDFATLTSYLTEGCANYQITAYADPKMDANWKVSNVPGFRALTDAEITLLDGDDYPDAKAAYAAGKLLGTWQTGGTVRMWFVKYRSPLRKPSGFSLLVR